MSLNLDVYFLGRLLLLLYELSLFPGLLAPDIELPPRGGPGRASNSGLGGCCIVSIIAISIIGKYGPYKGCFDKNEAYPQLHTKTVELEGHWPNIVTHCHSLLFIYQFQFLIHNKRVQQ